MGTTGHRAGKDSNHPADKQHEESRGYNEDQRDEVRNDDEVAEEGGQPVTPFELAFADQPDWIRLDGAHRKRRVGAREKKDVGRTAGLPTHDVGGEGAEARRIFPGEENDPKCDEPNDSRSKLEKVENEKIGDGIEET